MCGIAITVINFSSIDGLPTATMSAIDNNMEKHKLLNST